MFSLLKRQINDLDIFKVVFDNGLQPQVIAIARDFEKYDRVLVFGTGGSSLGAKALIEFKTLFDGCISKICFIENVDARSFSNVISVCDPLKTGVIVISKSGKTTETLLLFSTLIEIWPDFDWARNAIAITENSTDNDLMAIAKQKNMKILDHNKKIGGRFSVFSIVGLLPAAIAGVNINSFVDGARKLLRQITDENCGIYGEIRRVVGLLNQGVTEHVIFSYSDFLAGFGKWAAQLISESLGKRKDFGITPINATGTVDQHSMLQLFLGGPDNKYYTVIIQKNNFPVKAINTAVDTTVMRRLNGHTIGELMNAHQRATIEVLRRKSHVRVFEFDELSEEALGYLMMLSFVETIAIANLLNINPFDQPAVEESKKLAMAYLSSQKKYEKN